MMDNHCHVVFQEMSFFITTLPVFDGWIMSTNAFCIYLFYIILEKLVTGSNPAVIDFIKINNGNTIRMCETCSNLTIVTPKQSH